MGLMEEMAQLEKAGVDDTLTINKETGEVEQPKIEAVEPAKEPEHEPEIEAETKEDREVEQEAEQEPEQVDKKQAARDGYNRRKSARERELEEKLAKLAENYQHLEGKLSGMASVMQKPAEQPKQENIPDPQQDPDAYRDWYASQTSKKTQDLAKQLEQTQQQLLFTAAQQELRDKEVAFKSSVPDYDEAIEHGIQRVIKQQKMLNPGLSEDAIRAQLNMERVQFAARMQAQGKNPAQGLYELMTEVYGYTPKAKESGKPAEVAKFETVKANKAKMASGAASGGATGVAPVSAEAVKSMTLADFAKLSADDQMRIFGRA